MIQSHIIPDKWFSEIFKYDVYRLSLPESSVDMPREDRDLFETIRKQKPVFIYSKVSVLSIDQIAFLEEQGFHLADTGIVFHKKIERGFQNNEACRIRFSTPGDQEDVRRIAHRNFKYSRFHLDPLIPQETANRLKADWAGNFFLKKRGNAMVVAEKENSVVGFLQLLFDKPSLIIDLIAVDHGNRGKKIASNMIAFAESRLEGFATIRVGTQAANQESIGLYEKMGFRIDRCYYVFHYHN